MNRSGPYSMDPLQLKDDDDLNFDKSGIQLRLNRLIEKQTKRYESFISSGRHSDAQQLLQIIWQLKQIRLPGVDDVSTEQSIPPDRLAPMLEPFLKDSLNDSQLSLLFEKAQESAPSEPPIEPMEPSMPELLKVKAPVINSTSTQMLSPAPPSFPSIPAPIIPPSTKNQEPPPNVVQAAFDDISSGEFDIVVKDHFQPPLQKIGSPVETSMAARDFEDESSQYDDPEANAPLRGLTTGHAPVVRKEDLINYRKEVRDAIAWEEEDEIAPARTRKKSKSYLRDKVEFKSSQSSEDSSGDNNSDQLNENVDREQKGASKKGLIKAVGVAAAVLILGGLGIFAFISMSAPKFDDLEKMGQQNSKSPFEMEQLYSKAASASPGDPRGWSGLSYWQSRQGRTMPALESQAKAIKLTPKDAKLWYALALLLKTCSNYKESLRAANEAVALEPQNSQYLSLQEQVQEYNP